MYSKKTEFISVEIMLETDHDPLALVSYFEDRGTYVNHLDGAEYKHKIYLDPIPGQDANTVIKKLCALIQRFPEDVGRVWDASGSRMFFAGYHVGEEPHWFPETFDLETIALCHELQVEIGIALYPAELTDENGLPLEEDDDCDG